jgi:endoglucanase
LKSSIPAILSLAGFILATTNPAGAQAPPALKVQGNHLVDPNGDIVRLRGVDRSGSEYACVQGFGFFDGPVDAASIAAMKAWHINAVRVPLNEDCWGQDPSPSGGIVTQNQYTGQAYRNAIITYVNALNSAGLYVILDLHWNVYGCLVARVTRTEGTVSSA